MYAALAVWGGRSTAPQGWKHSWYGTSGAMRCCMQTFLRIRLGVLIDVLTSCGSAGEYLLICFSQEERLKLMVDAMKMDDYVHLLKTFNGHFGSFIVMETDNEDYIGALS